MFHMIPFAAVCRLKISQVVKERNLPGVQGQAQLYSEFKMVSEKEALGGRGIIIL